QLTHPPCLGHRLIDVRLKAAYRAPKKVQMVEQEVRQVVLVGLRIEKRLLILAGSLVDDFRDRDEFAEPVSLSEHRPVKERPCAAPIPVDEGMVIGQPEVQYDRTHHRV